MSTTAHTEHHHHVEVTTHAKGPHHVLRDVLDTLVLLVLAAATIYLWPANFGGNTHIIVVQGHSMEPKYHIGDALIVKPIADPKVGDIIVFRIPDGEAGAGTNVVHRVYRFREDGTIQTKGDNRDTPDMWRLTKKDVLGTPLFMVAQAGTVVGWFRSPMLIAICCFLIVLMWTGPGVKDRLRVGRRSYPSPDEHLANARDEIEELWTRLLAPAPDATEPIVRPAAVAAAARVAAPSGPAVASSPAAREVSGASAPRTDADWMRWFDEFVAAEESAARGDRRDAELQSSSSAER